MKLIKSLMIAQINNFSSIKDDGENNDTGGDN